MLLADSIEVVKGRVDVAFCAGDEGSVALSGIAEPCEGLVGLWSLLLDLLSGRVDIALSSLGGCDDIVDTRLPVGNVDNQNGSGSTRSGTY